MRVITLHPHLGRKGAKLAEHPEIVNTLKGNRGNVSGCRRINIILIDQLVVQSLHKSLDNLLQVKEQISLLPVRGGQMM